MGYGAGGRGAQPADAVSRIFALQDGALCCSRACNLDRRRSPSSPAACRLSAASTKPLCNFFLFADHLQPDYEVVLIGYRGAALIDELAGPAADGRLSLAYLPDL